MRLKSWVSNAALATVAFLAAFLATSTAHVQTQAPYLVFGSSSGVAQAVKATSNALWVTVQGGTISPDKICLDNTNKDACIDRSTTKTLQFDTDGAGGQLTGINFDATTNTFQGSIVIPTNRFYLFNGQGGLSSGGDGKNKLSNNAASSTFTIQTTGVPTCSSNCGTSPSIAGSDSSGKVTMGASGSPASGWVITFASTWSAAPVCVVQSALTTMVVGKMPINVATTTTTATITTNGTAPSASDAYFYHCFI